MRIVLVVTLTLLFTNTCFSQKKEHINTTSKKFARDTIIWKKDSLLTADNFQSKGKSNELAFTSSGILFHADVMNPSIFYVEAIFMKSKSFIKQNAPYVLKHEQLHFDITELYARKLRQMVHETDFKKVKNINAEISKMYNKVSADEMKEQNKYDKDTEHGINAAKQQVWDENIAKQLASTEEFSSTEIHITK